MTSPFNPVNYDFTAVTGTAFGASNEGNLMFSD